MSVGVFVKHFVTVKKSVWGDRARETPTTGERFEGRRSSLALRRKARPIYLEHYRDTKE